MTPRLGFVVTRSAEMKVYAPVIIEALRRNYHVTLLCGPRSWYGDFPLYQPRPENIQFPGFKQVTFAEYDSFTQAARLVDHEELDHLFTLRFGPKEPAYEMAQVTRSLPPIHILQFMADFLVLQPKYLPQISSVLTYTPFMADIYQQAHPQVERTLIAEHFAAVGNPLFDALPQIEANKEEILERYHLPKDKPLVLFLSINLDVTFWLRYLFYGTNPLLALVAIAYRGRWRNLPDLFTRPTYREVVESIAVWCHQQNAAFIVKTRAKQREPSWLTQLSDNLISDTATWYPHPTLELLSLSQMAIGFSSTTMIEAAAAQAYMLSVDVRSRDDGWAKGSDFLESGIYRDPRLSANVDFRQFPRFLASHSLTDFMPKPEALSPYAARFLGSLDAQASKRVIDKISLTA